MRELKFRALCEVEYKDSPSKEMMIHFTHLELDNGLWYNPDDDNIYHINEWLSKPMQFTGLRDCFGIEIYEGDTLVDVDTELEEGVKLQDTQQQVYWCEKLGCWKLDNTFIQDASSGYLLANDLKDFRFRVYSNIYSKAWEEKNKATAES